MYNQKRWSSSSTLPWGDSSSYILALWQSRALKACWIYCTGCAVRYRCTPVATNYKKSIQVISHGFWAFVWLFYLHLWQYILHSSKTVDYEGASGAFLHASPRVDTSNIKGELTKFISSLLRICSDTVVVVICWYLVDWAVKLNLCFTSWLASRYRNYTKYVLPHTFGLHCSIYGFR